MSAKMGFAVMKTPCSSCIFKKNSPLDLEKLLRDITDEHGFLKGYRVCHHSTDDEPACCRGFWNAYKDDFQAGQLAQRLGFVRYVTGDQK